MTRDVDLGLTQEGAVRRHAIARLAERFDLTITNDDHQVLSAEVGTRLNRPDGFSPTGRPVFRIIIEGVIIFAGWHENTAQIGTFHRGDRCRLRGKR